MGIVLVSLVVLAGVAWAWQFVLPVDQGQQMSEAWRRDHVYRSGTTNEWKS